MDAKQEYKKNASHERWLRWLQGRILRNGPYVHVMWQEEEKPSALIIKDTL